MTEVNAPIDVGNDLIKPYKKDVKNLLTAYSFNASTTKDLTNLIQNIDADNDDVMENIERDTYLSIREGMQIFKAVRSLVGDKVGLGKKLVSTPASQYNTDPELLKLQGFAQNFAAYVAAKYISKKVKSLVSKETEAAQGAEKPDLSRITLDPSKMEPLVINQMLNPIYLKLVEHLKDDKRDIFKTPVEFPVYVTEVFDKVAELALANKDKYADMNKNIDPYRFKIMDDFLSLQGFDDKSAPVITMKENKPAYQPINPNDIVGNRSSKKAIARYAQRLCLYDPVKQMNPILQLGGMPWSMILDGPPGTGKTSMLRMLMTLVDDYATRAGLKFYMANIDQSIKDEYYGKSGKILLERLTPTKDASMISIAAFEDIDLLTSKRSDAQGADNDINSILMQYLDGAFTVRRGNVFNLASTNKATGLDEAMRNRFNARELVTGPETGEDFADVMTNKFKNLDKAGLLKMKAGYTPFATQDHMELVDGKKKWTGAIIAKMADAFGLSNKDKTMIDFGNYMAELKKKNPGITGRSANAIAESIAARTADFDIPEVWFDDRKIFLDQPFEQKIVLLKDLYTPVTAEILFEEAKKYADSEARYGKQDEAEAVTKGYNNKRWAAQADMKYLQEEIGKGITGSTLGKMAALESKYSKMQEEAKNAVEDAFKKSPEEGKAMIEKMMGDLEAK